MAHEVLRREEGTSLSWVNRHFVHKGSYHAFGKLAARTVPVAAPELTFAVSIMALRHAVGMWHLTSGG
jgi:3-isopropylmalate/(R)-2-methylmalate dehydratase large subunit